MISIFAAAAIAITGPDDALRSVAERTDFTRTATYAETVALLDALDESSEFASRATMGHSVEGRELPMLILSDPPAHDASQVRELSAKKGRPVVLAIGNIHGGEIDGKEALPMLARDILHGGDRALLHDIILIIAPIYNADGNERMGADTRPGQNGPTLTGVRENANGRDLNRDFMKLEEPETRGLVSTFDAFGAHVFIDCHITNGSYHRYVVTYDGPRSPSGDSRINAFARNIMLPGIDSRFESSTGSLAFWYGSFEGEFGEAERGHSRWESYPAEPRFGTTYFGLRNRFSILVESYTYAPFRERVHATRDFVKAGLEWIGANSKAMLSVIEEADSDASTSDFSTQSIARAEADRVLIAGYEERTENGRSFSTGVPKDYSVELMTNFVSQHSVSRAIAYAIPSDAAFDSIIDTLCAHGIKVSTSQRELQTRIERYVISKATPASRTFQGHVLVRCETSSTISDGVIPAGWRIVECNQPLSNLAQALLEPTAEDSLATWNRFDAWMKPGAEYPVLRIVR